MSKVQPQGGLARGEGAPVCSDVADAIGRALTGGWGLSRKGHGRCTADGSVQRGAGMTMNRKRTMTESTPAQTETYLSQVLWGAALALAQVRPTPP